MSFQFHMERYNEQQEEKWPCQGRHFLSQFDDVSIIVYQIVVDEKRLASNKRCDQSAEPEKHTGTGGKDVNANDDPPLVSADKNTETAVAAKCETEETTTGNRKEETENSKKNSDNEKQPEQPFVLLQTSFIRMLFSWKSRKGSEHEKVVAIAVKTEGFEELLRVYADDMKTNQSIGDVKVEWNPDRSLMGELLKRYVPEIGIRGDILQQFNNDWTLHVKDISGYVENLRRYKETDEVSCSWTPKENIYISELSDVCSKLGIDNDGCALVEKNPEGTLELNETFAEACTHENISNSRFACGHSREAILVLYGTFNPIHVGHVNALVESKRWLETTGNYQVCATRIAVTSDSNIKAKFKDSGDLCIKFEHRRRLCELACLDHPWIKIFGKPAKSQARVGEQLRRKINKPDATLVFVVGSDRAYLSKRRVQTFRTENGFFLCVGRKGMSRYEEKNFKKAERNDLKRALDFYVVPTELNDISSTAIRQNLSRVIGNKIQSTMQSGNDLQIINEMIELCWITVAEGLYILQHTNDMYF